MAANDPTTVHCLRHSPGALTGSLRDTHTSNNNGTNLSRTNSSLGQRARRPLPDLINHVSNLTNDRLGVSCCAFGQLRVKIEIIDSKGVINLAIRQYCIPFPSASGGVSRGSRLGSRLVACGRWKLEKKQD